MCVRCGFFSCEGCKAKHWATKQRCPACWHEVGGEDGARMLLNLLAFATSDLRPGLGVSELSSATSACDDDTFACPEAADEAQPFDLRSITLLMYCPPQLPIGSYWHTSVVPALLPQQFV